MPGYARYVAVVHAQRHERSQPRGAEMLAGLRERARRWPRLAREVRSVRLAAALVSFTDDLDGPFAAEAFDDRAVHALIGAVAASDRPLTVLDLIDACADQPTLLDAVLVVHGALRHLARGRDGRAFPSSMLPLDERLAIGRVLLPFAEEESRGGDPLGDAYHYAANVAAGLAATTGVRRAWLVPLFAAGPELMWGVRQEWFGSVLFFGNHARIDRMGLSHGLAVGLRACRDRRRGRGTSTPWAARRSP